MSFRSLTPKNGGIPRPSFRARAHAAPACPGFCPYYEPQAQLIGPHGGGRGAVCEQVQLAFLDTVLDLAAGAVDPLIQPSGVDLGRWQRGDDEARIGLTLGPFRLADDAADAAPAIAGGPAEVPEAAGGLAGLLGCGARRCHLGRDLARQPRIARQAEDIVHAVGFT